ncbi:MAG: TRAP transporter substrate-binding protein DctP [Chloroflexi bacterium]|nr:TRAP transporter substrate-binding protein DctP [Chloroflexota bacterium]
MKKRSLFFVVSLLVAVVLFAGFGCSAPSATPAAKQTPAAAPAAKPAAPQAAVIKWNMQTVYPMESKNTDYFATEWVKWVKQITNGRLQIELHPPGTFASGTEVLTAVSKGTIQAALDYSGYYGKTFPISNVESGLPLAWYNFTDVYDAFYNRGLLQLIREEYGEKNILNLSINVPGGGYHFGTKFPFKSLDDIKGKKIRATGVYADYVKALGGSPTVVSGAEMYMSLKTGIIDGMIFGMSTLQSYKLAEIITDYLEDPPIGLMVSAGPQVNMDAWKALPEDIRKLIEENTAYFYGVGNANYDIYTRNAKIWSLQKYQVKFHKFSAADEAKAWSTVLPIWDNIAKLSPRNAKAVEIVKQQMKDVGRLK